MSVSSSPWALLSCGYVTLVLCAFMTLSSAGPLLMIKGGTVVNHDHRKLADVLIDVDSGLILKVERGIQVRAGG